MSYSDASHLNTASRPSSAERLLVNGPGSDTTEHSDEKSWANARQYQDYPRSGGHSPNSTRKYTLPNLPQNMNPRSHSTNVTMPTLAGGGAAYYDSASSNESYVRGSAPTSGYTSSGYSSARGKSLGYLKASANPSPAWMSKTQDMSDDEDDALHDYRDAHKSGSIYSGGFPVRALVNVGFLALLGLALLGLFAGYPIVAELTRKEISTSGGLNLGGVNSTGQIADLPDLPQLIDPDTPESAMFRTSFEGVRQRLVFSDEFNTDGRSFYPGDDPFWEAVDLHYWGTGNYEWYDPAAISTHDGALHIELQENPNHNLNFRGGMLATWNQFCFTGGYLVASVRLPGRNDVPGLWPAFWSMGNLGRAGYGASLEGLWPYSYESCDVGTLQNQTDSRGNPAAAVTGGASAFNRPFNTQSLSWAAGQKLSACTCPGEDHPGPIMPDGSFKGRASPEIDVFEAQAGRNRETGLYQMEVSQSFQLAPFNHLYEFSNSSGPAYEFYTDQSILNSYTGAILQQAASAITTIPQAGTEIPGGQFEEYGFEYVPGITDESYITWTSGGEPSWKLNNAALDPDPVAEIGRRPVSNEPMYIILNLGVSQSFGTPDWDRLAWPATMSVDWVRVYQDEDNINIGCDPPDYPTTDYINRHWEAYTQPEKIVWGLDAERGGLGEFWPRNRLDGGCDAPPAKTPGNPERPHPKAVFVPANDLPNY